MIARLSIQALCRHLLCTLLGACCVILCASATADEAQTELAKLKTAYLFNIAKFVRWQDAQPHVHLCIEEGSSVLPVAMALDARPLGPSDRLLRVRVVGSGRAEHMDCHLLFGYSDLRLMSVAAQSESVLAISDSNRALQAGYVIQLFMQREKLRFAVDTPRLKGAPYKISSKLLRLARTPN